VKTFFGISYLLLSITKYWTWTFIRV